MEKKSILVSICLPFFLLVEASAQRLGQNNDLVVSKTYVVESKDNGRMKTHTGAKRVEYAEELVAVVFSGFKAEELPSGLVLLSWNSYPESSSHLFFIERSEDDIHWVEVAQYSGSGNAESALCSFVDDEKNVKRQYYRLRQIDVNGNLEYAQKTKLIAVDQNRTCKQHSGRTKVCFRIQSDKEIDRMELLTESGKLVYSEFPKTKTVDINLKNNFKEPYFVTMYSADSVVKRKLLVN